MDTLHHVGCSFCWEESEVFKRKNKNIHYFPSVSFINEVMGIHLTERRYQNLKNLSDTFDNSDYVMACILTLANLGLINTKPFKDDLNYNCGEDSK